MSVLVSSIGIRGLHEKEVIDRIAVKVHQISKKLCGHRKAISDELIAINGA